MNLSSAKTVTFKNKDVKEISIGGSRVWKKAENLWDLSQRTEIVPTNSTVNATTTSISGYLGSQNYLTSAYVNGKYLYNYNCSTIGNITANGFTITCAAGNQGLGIAFPVTAGQTISLTLRKTANCYVRLAYYDSSGIWNSYVDFSNYFYSKNNTVASASENAPITGTVMLICATYGANVAVTFSDIILSIA